MIGHVIVLFCLHYRSHTIRSILTFKYRILRRSHLYNWPRPCLSAFRDRLNPILSILIVHYRILRRSHLYNRSGHCPFFFVIGPFPIRQVMTVQFRFQQRPDLYDQSRRCPFWSLSQTIPRQIGHNSSVLFLTQSESIQSVTTFSDLIFFIDHTISI